MPDRVPLALSVMLDRIGVTTAPFDAETAVAAVRTRRVTLQDFRPLTESLEWELSRRHWTERGLDSFVENRVPFLINNSGRLSHHCAAVLHANCIEHRPAGEVAILELGAGLGLFARYFLDAFRERCAAEGTDFYERLVFYVTDSSPRTVEQWSERGLFDGHRPGVVRPGVCDALAPAVISLHDGTRQALPRLRAVFGNYVLDVLPSTVARRGPSGAEELLVRTHLVDDHAVVAQYTTRSSDDIRALAASDVDRSALAPLVSLFDLESSYRTPVDHLPLIAEALEGVEEGERAVVSYGAIATLDAALALLDPAGIILINDYGSSSSEPTPNATVAQRFGSTTALGVNFGLIERHYGQTVTVASSDGDAHRGIYSRMLHRAPLPVTSAAFIDRFSLAIAEQFDRPLNDARAHAAAGRRSEALQSYHEALSTAPSEWPLLGEVAEYAGLQLRDLSAGRDLVLEALRLNPCYSPWLWNILGDILFIGHQVDGAHEAYLQAQRIDPSDTRTNMNLSFTLLERGEPERALQALATALASDATGVSRSRLLEKQQQILSAMTTRTSGERERLERRAERLR